MIHLLPVLEWIRSEGGEIWLDGDKIRYRFPHQPPFPLMEELKRVKADLLQYLRLEQEMRKAGWLILSPIEGYEYRLSANHSVFLFVEGNGWTVWRATWYQKPQPVKEKTLAEGIGFIEAIQIANDYIQWFQAGKDRKRSA